MQLPHIRCVAAGGDLCACVAGPSSGYMQALHDLAASERRFLVYLRALMTSVVTPILNSGL